MRQIGLCLGQVLTGGDEPFDGAAEVGPDQLGPVLGCVLDRRALPGIPAANRDSRFAMSARSINHAPPPL